MTDSRMFRTIVFIRATGVVKQFVGFNHHARAIAWLARQGVK